ncbi:MAG TPA: ABC transporter substrate-binding protein [Burkholderiaceae bacterium]|nr:ABC transporter substrate-binding protein [Burkholderiaceae bacterium]
MRTVPAVPAAPLHESRRSAIKATAAGGLGVMIWMKNDALLAQDMRLLIRDPGGAYAEGCGEAFYKPFRAATGIEIVAATGQHQPTAFIRTMVETKTYTWDMAHVSKDVHDTLSGLGHLEALNLDAALKDLPAQFRTPYYAGVDTVGIVLSYRTDRMPAGKAPRQWQDFWDTKAFPGRRALRRNPMETLEHALLGDGVAPGALYPLDLDRAFRSLDRIKKDVSVWWTGGAQTSQLLKSGEVDLCPTWNGRAQAVVDEGAPVALMWSQYLYASEGWVIPKGSPKADLCREFIKFATSPERQAVFTKSLAYGPTLPKAYDFIDPKRARTLPTHPDHIKGGTEWNTAYWAKQRDPVTERFNAWVTA